MYIFGECGVTLGSSFGYRGEDGKSLSQGKRAEVFGPVFGVNDVIGCGIEYTSSAVFFTKNGEYIGSSGRVSSLPLRYFPAVSMSTAGDAIRANFGSEPFQFNLDEYTSSVIEEEVNRISARSVSESAAKVLVAKYLDFSGYAESAKMMSPDTISSSLSIRSSIRSAILNGNSEAAISLVEENFPHVLTLELPAVLLYSQSVIEKVRLSDDYADACMYLKKKLSVFHDSTNPKVLRILQETCSMFCYENPARELESLFSQSQRETVWMNVNESIQSPKQDPIQLIIRQIVACQSACRIRGFRPCGKSICKGPVRTRKTSID